MTINKKLENKCRTLAEKAIFVGIESLLKELNILGLEYRKNKDVSNVKQSILKGVRSGKGKIELEVEMAGLYLCSVLKLITSKGNV